MARAFTQSEREVIRQKLIEKGREAFSTFGLKKTSVDDLTQAVGISKGSFYAFFRSKEDLYLEIIEAEESRFREQVIARTISNQPITKHTIKNFILEGLRVMETNPLFRRMYEKNEFDQVLRAVSPERLAKHIQSDEDWLSKLIETWQEQGLVVDADPKAIAGVIKLIVVSSFLKDSIGGKSYPEAINLLADLVASGLATKG
ncbi:MAG TPA: TetR/AcrR family transcriptional regulator [Anaerolineae bacterium]|jgi:AcrR family transcriptional regulator|nr:TetR/AcrR family transcriptional regulator [Anaerolineae bacterium]